MSQAKIIAIAGGSGSGKSYLARCLSERMSPEAVLLTLDDFYHDLSDMSEQERERVNFDDPAAIDWIAVEQALEGLLQGREVVIPCYDFTTHTRKTEGKVVIPARWILIEGLWPLTDELVRRMSVMKIFIDCPSELRLARRIARDTVERGRSEESVRRQFSEHVGPMHELHVQPQIEWADEVLPADFSESDVERLWQKLNR
jgi:uridine kinase